MLRIEEVTLLFYSQPIDMRKSIDSLCVLVVETLHRNPMDGTLFLFRNRQGNKLKVLYYEVNCFSVWYRRLEKGRYLFQRNVEGEIEMSKEHFSWLLASDKYGYREAMLMQEKSYFY